MTAPYYKARDVHRGFSERILSINHSYICVVLSGFVRFSEEKKNIFGQMVIGYELQYWGLFFNEKESLKLLERFSGIEHLRIWVCLGNPIKNIPKKFKILLHSPSLRNLSKILQ